jgi:hypothetical protein
MGITKAFLFAGLARQVIVLPTTKKSAEESFPYPQIFRKTLIVLCAAITALQQPQQDRDGYQCAEHP